MVPASAPERKNVLPSPLKDNSPHWNGRVRKKRTKVAAAAEIAPTEKNRPKKDPRIRTLFPRQEHDIRPPR